MQSCHQGIWRWHSWFRRKQDLKPHLLHLFDPGYDHLGFVFKRIAEMHALPATTGPACRTRVRSRASSRHPGRTKQVRARADGGWICARLKGYSTPACPHVSWHPHGAVKDQRLFAKRSGRSCGETGGRAHRLRTFSHGPCSARSTTLFGRSWPHDREGKILRLRTHTYDPARSDSSLPNSRSTCCKLHPDLCGSQRWQNRRGPVFLEANFVHMYTSL